MYQPIDETADVYTYGAMIYSVVSGLYLSSDLEAVKGREDFEVCFLCHSATSN